jgi:UDP-N-acetylmuramyl tripeptide synthase
VVVTEIRRNDQLWQVLPEFSDKVVFTSDNPRNEDPDVIAEMELVSRLKIIKKY